MEREASKEVGRMLAVRARPPVALRLALELFKILPAHSRDPQAFSVTRTGPNMGPDKIINIHMELVAPTIQRMTSPWIWDCKNFKCFFNHQLASYEKLKSVFKIFTMAKNALNKSKSILMQTRTK